ncbi:hypothetical protein CRUP_021534 [Coryphaenoides rupestris]|nr:hypothetical protein CRUP_021534 [Coryphaenoides rupestris]
MADVTELTHGSMNSTESEAIQGSEDDFVPSKLGTKLYWDKEYQTELEIFRDIGDVGEIWFGEQSMVRVIRWMEKAKIPKNASILDIGTGNGVFLLELAKEGYTNITGIDYSAASVALAKDVLQAEDLSHISVKGTFDAISLNPEDTKEVRTRYVRALSGALKEGGYFVITSCNWTKEQLLQRFSPGFELVQQLPTPCIQFGGKTGNNVTALIFKRLH